MSNLKTEEYTTSSGNVFPKAEMSDVVGVLSKAYGMEIGSVIVLRSGGVLLCPPKAPKKPEPVISKGPASAGASAQDMMAQLAAMMAQLQGLTQPAKEAQPAPAGLSLGAPAKGRNASPKRRAG